MCELMVLVHFKKFKKMQQFKSLILIFSILIGTASADNEASRDIQTIKTLVTQIFQWYKNEMQTLR